MIDKLQRNLWLNSGKLDAEKTYWLAKLGSRFRFTGFPADRPAPGGRPFPADAVRERLPDELSARLDAVSGGSEYARFTILLAGVKLLLARYARSSDVSVGMPVFKSKNGNDVRLNAYVPLRAEVDSGRSFKELLAETKKTVTEASAHSNFPFEELARLTGLPSGEDGRPRIAALVVYEAVHEEAPEEAAFDIRFTFRRETDGALSLTVDYDGRLYERETVGRIVRHLFVSVRDALERPSAPLRELSSIPEGELPEPPGNAAGQVGASGRPPGAAAPGAGFHPLMSRFAEQSANRWTLETDLNVPEFWELNEHSVHGRYILPGAAYLEMAAFGGRAYFGRPEVLLEDVQIRVPLALKEKASLRLRAVLEKDGERLLFRAESSGRPAEPDEAWTVHATCSVSPLEARHPEALDLAAVRERCGASSVVTGPEDRYPKTEGLGPRWQSIESYRYCDAQALVRVALDERYASELPSYFLHPALLDLCTVPYEDEDRLYLPIGCKRVKAFAPLSGKLNSRLIRKGTQGRGEGVETVSYDIDIADDEGRILAAIEDAALRVIRDPAAALKSLDGQAPLFHRVTWIPVQAPEPAARPDGGALLLLRDRTELGDSLARLCAERGWEVVEALPGDRFERLGESRYAIGGGADDYERLADALSGFRFTHIVHMFHEADRPASSPADLARLSGTGVWSLYHLVRALHPRLSGRTAELLLVSRSAYPVTSGEKELRPAHAPLLGLGRVVAAEFPSLRCRGLDIDESATAELLHDELASADRPPLAAYRGGTPYFEMLEEAEEEGEEPSSSLPNVTENGVYAITGGMGGLGLETAGLLSSGRPVRLALIGRSKWPDRSEWEAAAAGGDRKLAAKLEAVRRMEANGTVVALYDADAADEARMSEVFADIRERLGPIRGVVHAAGVAGDGLLSRRSPEEFRAVLSPKIEGTLVLDRLTAEDPLEFMVLYSSIATLGGAAGQGDYTAANSFLDAFAAYRSRLGKRTLAVNWAGWKELGMAADYGAEETYFKSLPTRTALCALARALGRDESRLVIGELNAGHPVFDDPKLPLRLSPDLTRALRAFGSVRLPVRESDSPPDGGGTAEAATELELRIADLVRRLLGLDEVGAEDDFFDLGGHSILAIKLLAEFEKLGLPADGLDVYQDRTPRAMAAFITSREGEST